MLYPWLRSFVIIILATAHVTGDSEMVDEKQIVDK